MSWRDRQVGGYYYRNMAIQPLEFILANDLLFAEGNVIKLVCRHRAKGGKESLLKAIHYLEALIESEYPDEG